MSERLYRAPPAATVPQPPRARARTSSGDLTQQQRFIGGELRTVDVFVYRQLNEPVGLRARTDAHLYARTRERRLAARFIRLGIGATVARGALIVLSVLPALMLWAYRTALRLSGCDVSIRCFVMVSIAACCFVSNFVGVFAQVVLLDVLEAQVDAPARAEMRALRAPVGVDCSACAAARGER